MGRIATVSLADTRNRKLLAAALAVPVLAAAGQSARASLYWDLDAAAGAGSTTPSGTWDTTALDWNADSGGVGAPGTWVSGETAVFSAGTNATGAYTVTLNAPVTAAGITKEEGAAVTISSTGAGAITFSGGALAVDVQAGTLVINSLFSPTTGVVTKSGAGILSVGTTQTTFAGKWVVNGGSLSFPGDLRLGVVPGSAVADQVTLNGGNLRTSTNGAAFHANRGITLGANGGGFDQAITLTWSGPITGNSGGALKVAGTGTTVLTNTSNNYDGGTTFTAAGTLQLGAAGVIPDTSLVTMVASSTLNLNGFDETVRSLTGTAGSVTLGGNKLTLANPAGETFGGMISGTSGTLTKNGAGTLTLTGANTYTGTTAVSAGALLVNGSHAGAGNYAVNSGSTLGGSGVVTLAADKSVSATGTLSPGSAAGQVGTLKVNVSGANGAVVVDGGKFAVEFSGNAKDVLDVTGKLTVNAGSTLAITDSGTHSLGLYKIAGYASRDGTGGGGTGKFDTVTGLGPNFLLLYAANEIDLQQKAKIGTVSSPVVTVIKGGVTPVALNVANGSPTGSAALNFSATNLAAGLAGAGAGTAAPQATGTGALSFDSTGVAGGAYNPGFTITGDVDTTQGGDVNGAATITVLEHSSVSFNGAGNKNLLIDFGAVAPGANGGSISGPFDIFNDVVVAGFTAGLDLDHVLGAGDVGTFALTGPSTFSNLAAGSMRDYTILFDTTQVGTFTATYTFQLSDQDLPGATAAGSDVITLNITGAVVPEPTFAWMGLGLLGSLGAVRRGRRAPWPVSR